MPTGIIHNDVVEQNILAKDGKLQCIIDFTDMAFSPYVQNVAVALTHNSFFFNWKPYQAGILIKGYREFHTLSSEEASLLYELVLARYADVILSTINWDRRFGPDDQRTAWREKNYSCMRKFLKLGHKKFNSYIKL
jgi:ethanolamine-phosphate phospho-lyase